MAKKLTSSQVSYIKDKPAKVSTTMAKPLTPVNLITVPQSFGTYKLKQPFDYPLDDIVIDVYNRNGQLLETLPTPTGPVLDFTIESDSISIDLEQQLKNYNYLAGEFTVEIRAIRNYLGAAQGAKLQIQEVSNDRLEIRVVPALINPNAQGKTENSDTIFQDFFSTGFFQLDKLSVLPNLKVYWTQQDSVKVFDYLQDKFTVQLSPYSIIFKLIEPLPSTLSVDDFVWITQEVSEPVVENVIIIPPIQTNQKTRIAGPNFDINAKKSLQQSTSYKNWDSVLTYASSSILNVAYSQSLVEGIPLNIDYTRYENFVHFGSAHSRVFNFTEKVKKLEYYQNIIDSISTDLIGLSEGSVSSSAYHIAQRQTYQNKIDTIKGAFDGFERYMYYESSSYVTNSFGEFLDAAWPKSNSEKPYTLYGSNTTQVQNWLTGIYESASVYDQNNPHRLQSFVPSHILEDEANETALVLVDMIGHYFDAQYSYVDHFTKIHNRDQSLTEGFAKDLVYHIAQSLGADFDNGQSFDDLWSYTLGFNSSGSFDNALNLSSEDRTREVWKRIITNLPYLTRTRGTERGLRALINCFGLPSTIIRIREFGGPEPDFDTQSTYNHDRFYYALNVGRGDRTTNPPHIVLPWTGSDGTSTGRFAPNGVSIRFKAAPFSGSIRRYNLMSWYSASTFADSITKSQLPIHTMDIGRDGGGDFIQWQPNSHLAVPSTPIKLYIPTSSNNPALFDGKWVTTYITFNSASHTLIQASPFSGSITSSFNLYAGLKSDYSDVPLIYSASQTYSGSNLDLDTSVSFSDWRVPIYWGINNPGMSSGLTAKTLLIGSSSAPRGVVTASFSGSIQELRYWGTSQYVNDNASRVFTASALLVTQSGQLESSPFYAHVISPTTIVGPNKANPDWTGATSSFNDLVYRLNLGTDNKKTTLTTRESSSYRSFIVTSSRGTSATFALQVQAPLLTTAGFPAAPYDSASMSISTFPTGYDLYIYDRAFGAVNNSTTEVRTVLNIFDAGYSILSIGNDTSRNNTNVTGSNGTTWPILSSSAAAIGVLNWSGSKANTVPFDDLIGAGWTDWNSGGDVDSGNWIDQINTRPGTNVICIPLAVSGNLQPTTSPETNTTAHFLAFYAYDTVRGGRWVHINGPYSFNMFGANVMKGIRDFLLRREDSSSFSYGTQPNQNISWLPSSSYRGAVARFVNYSGSTQSYWTPVTETNYMPWPDISGNRQVSSKIRVDQTYQPSEQLYWNVKTEKGLQDSQPTDSPRLGVYLSTADQVNEDIAEQFGGIHLDDYIGSYADVYESTYDSLEDVQREYFKKYRWRQDARFKSQNYIRLLSNFDGALFNLVKQFVPYRANLQTGLVVEPHILHRPKIASRKPTIEDLSYEALIEIPDQTQTPGGAIQDAAGGGQANYVWEAEIDQQYVTPVGDYPTQADGAVSTETTLTVRGLQNEFNNGQVEEQGVYDGSLYSTVHVDETSYGRNKSEGSQYDFYTWFKTGSGDADYYYSKANSRDYWDPIQTVVLDSRKSETMLIADAGVSYNRTDIYKGTGSFLTGGSNLTLTMGAVADANLDVSGSLRTLGVRVATTSQSIESYYDVNRAWVLNRSFGYMTYFVSSSVVNTTGSIKFNAFSPQADYFDVSLGAYRNSSAVATTMSIWYGDSGSTSTPDRTENLSTNSTTIYNQRVLQSQIQNRDLYIEFYVNANTGVNASYSSIIDDLVVKAYKYAQVQDYHCGDNATTGQKNQKYNGSKLTSNDYNEDSPDTIDGGPVISIIEGPGVTVAVNPNSNGTYTFR